MKRTKGLRLLVFSLIVMLLCAAVTVAVDTAGGRVEVKLGKFINDQGKIVNYKVYIPENATPETPAPCIVYGVGGACSLDNGSMYAIEGSRRGYVVLTYDAAGNGQSELNAAIGAENNAEIAYQLATAYDFVDDQQIMQGGHSMGGWYSMVVSQNHQENVKLQFNVGMNFWGDAAKGYDFNFAYIIGSGDESALVRTTNYSTMDEMVQSAGLKAIIGAGEDERVEVDQVYGSFADETGRVVLMPKTIHIYEIFDPGTCKAYLKVVSDTVPMPNPIDINSLIYWVKELVMIVMFAALGVFAFAAAVMLLETQAFASLKLRKAEYIGFKPGSVQWIIAVIVLTVLTGMLFVWGYGHSMFTTYGNSNGKVTWSIVTAGILAVCVIVYHFAFGAKKNATLREYGFATKDEAGFSIMYLVKAVLFAIVVAAATYLYFTVFSMITQSNIHWSTVEINAIERQKMIHTFLPMFALTIPFVVANSVAQKLVLGYEGDDTKSSAKAYFLANFIGTAMMVILYAALVIMALCFGRAIYVKNRAYIGGESALGAAVGFWIANTVAYYLNKKTNSIWAGALTALLLITWFSVTVSGIVY